MFFDGVVLYVDMSMQNSSIIYVRWVVFKF